MTEQLLTGKLSLNTKKKNNNNNNNRFIWQLASYYILYIFYNDQILAQEHGNANLAYIEQLFK